MSVRWAARYCKLRGWWPVGSYGGQWGFFLLHTLTLFKSGVADYTYPTCPHLIWKCSSGPEGKCLRAFLRCNTSFWPTSRSGFWSVFKQDSKELSPRLLDKMLIKLQVNSQYVQNTQLSKLLKCPKFKQCKIIILKYSYDTKWCNHINSCHSKNWICLELAVAT